MSFHVLHIHHIKSQWPLISWYGYLRNLSAEIWPPRHPTFIVNLILLIWACPKSHFAYALPIIPGGFITCGQEEWLNGHSYLIIGYLDISNRLHNLFVSVVSGSLIWECLCLAHHFWKGFEVTVVGIRWTLPLGLSVNLISRTLRTEPLMS